MKFHDVQITSKEETGNSTIVYFTYQKDYQRQDETEVRDFESSIILAGNNLEDDEQILGLIAERLNERY